jgi:hypothetical protein
MTPSRHSVVVGGPRVYAERHQITVDRDPSDPILEAFFQDLDRQVVLPTVPNGPDMKPSRAPKGGRRGPVLTLAERHQVLDHIETPRFRQSSLHHVSGDLEIVRRGQTISLRGANGNTIRGAYLTDAAGGCRYNFRKDGYAGRAGIKGRGRGQRDARDPSLNQGILEPSIGLRKRDPATGGWIENSAIPGEWVAVSITLPLSKACLVGQKGITGRRVSLPGKLCVYAKRMTKPERALRDGQST